MNNSMGSILSSKVKEDGKVIFEVCMSYDEALQLGGHMDNIHLFSENLLKSRANMAQRGKNDATKYFLVPKDLRNNLKFKGEASCQRIDTKTKTIFVYVLDKNKPMG